MREKHTKQGILTQRIFYIFTIQALLSGSISGFAQKDYSRGRFDLIEASQTGSSPLFFQAGKSSSSLVGSSGFSNPSEFFVRDGLSNFFGKIKNGKDVTIGYIGGSITRANNQYRTQSLQYIQNMFPSITVTGLNAGISGTGADLGACRIHDQLLRYNPDLVFIEFAVNRAFAEGVEGIIRQIWHYNPKIDICLIYTISTGQAQIYATGGIPANIARLEQLAEHYSIPSIHMGLQAGFLEKQGKLVWKGDPKVIRDQIVFTSDGIHPLEAGGNLYSESIVRAMQIMKDKTDLKSHVFPQPLLPDNWEDAKMLDPLSVALFDGTWEKIDPTNSETLKSYSDWFPYVMKSGKPGSSFSFHFEGNMFGLFDIGGPETGQIEIEMDGHPISLEQVDMENFLQTDENSSLKAINRFNRYCNNRYRGQCAFVKVSPGKHKVKIIVSAQMQDKSEILGKNQMEDIKKYPDKYAQTILYLGKVLIRGKLLPLTN